MSPLGCPGYRARGMNGNKAAENAAYIVVNEMDERSGLWYRPAVDDVHKLA